MANDDVRYTLSILDETRHNFGQNWGISRKPYESRCLVDFLLRTPPVGLGQESLKNLGGGGDNVFASH